MRRHQSHQVRSIPVMRCPSAAGFTLLEVLVALVIVGTALGASLRAVGSLTQNSNGLRVSMMATWSAENRLTQIRLGHEWPDLGPRSFECPQGDLQLMCAEEVLATPNPFFRRVEVSVSDVANPERRIIKLAQIVPNDQGQQGGQPNVPQGGQPNVPQGGQPNVPQGGQPNIPQGGQPNGQQGGHQGG